MDEWGSCVLCNMPVDEDSCTRGPLGYICLDCELVRRRLTDPDMEPTPAVAGDPFGLEGE